MYRRFVFILLALLTAALPFAAPAACARALREGLALCGGPLLLSLFPFLIVSTLLARSGGGELLGALLRPAARLLGVQAPCAGGVLLLGLAGGFAPAANAAAQAVRAGRLSPQEAARLLPACICSGPSFVVLTVGQALLGSAALGLRLFAAQALAGFGAAVLLRRLPLPAASAAPEVAGPALPPLRLDAVIAEAAVSYCKLCGFILYFRLLAGGIGAAAPGLGLPAAMLLEICSGCDLAARSGRWAGWLCCAALSLQGASVLLQVRTICPAEVSFRPLLAARLAHLPLSLALFRLLLCLPGGAAPAAAALHPSPAILRRVPPDCALLAFLGCCLVVCQLSRALPPPAQQKRPRRRKHGVGTFETWSY